MTEPSCRPPEGASHPAQLPATPAGASLSASQEKPRPIPLSVRKKIEKAYDWREDDWAAIESHFESRVAELKPSLDSQYLKVLEIAFCDNELLEHSAHAGRVLLLAEQLAVREVLKPGYAQYAFGSANYLKHDPLKEMHVFDLHLVYIEGRELALNDFNNQELESELKRSALLKLTSMGMGAKALKTKALELRQEDLDKIHRRMAAIQARRDLLLESYAGERRLTDAVSVIEG